MADGEGGYQDQNFSPLPDLVHGTQGDDKQQVVESLRIKDVVKPEVAK
jgi:hypothetical protein